MSYNRSINFPKPLSGFKVDHIGDPSITAAQSNENALNEYNRGKAEATAFYQAEISKLRTNYADSQSKLLASIDTKTNEVIAKLDHRLPDLVIGLAERVLGQISLDRDAIEEIVRNMVSEFSGKDEKLEVFLCPQDLSLLKSMADSEKPAVEEEKGEEEPDEEIFDIPSQKEIIEVPEEELQEITRLTELEEPAKLVEELR